MKTLPLVIVSALYLWQASDFAIEGRWGFAVAFLCYAIANIAFIAAAKGPV